MIGNWAPPPPWPDGVRCIGGCLDGEVHRLIARNIACMGHLHKDGSITQHTYRYQFIARHELVAVLL